MRYGSRSGKRDTGSAGRDNLRTYGITQKQYREWKTKTLAYYASTAVECTEPEELDPDERLKRRIAYLNSLKPQNGE